MTRPVIESARNQYSNYNRYDNYESRYHQNPVINGYFPTHKTYKEMAISRVNRTLFVLLLLTIITAAVSYYFVTANEITLNKYRKQTLALNDENVELQNKLDYLKSYYNVDKAMQKQHLLQKADAVMEIKDTPVVAVSKQSTIDKVAEASQNQKNAQWALGF